MARPKEFDPEAAMREAMEAFWQRGYHATSVNDLLAEMKLNRGSLYGTFGDKKHLFLATLAEYEKQSRDVMKQILEQPGPAREAIEQWAMTAVEMCSGESGLRGCRGIKAALEMASQDKDVADWVRTITKARDQLLAKAVRRGQEAGEINPKLDPKVVAKALNTSLAGLKVLGTAAPTEKEVREVVLMMLRMLD
jgi:TetR/AcrR family transcriptional regulator, transcriptional repressor for nem operon